MKEDYKYRNVCKMDSLEACSCPYLGNEIGFTRFFVLTFTNILQRLAEIYSNLYHWDFFIANC